MIKLTGTEKQIEWANKIRVDFVTKSERLKRHNQGLGDAAFWEMLNTEIEKFFSIQDAKFWIDNRNETIEKALGNAKRRG